MGQKTRLVDFHFHSRFSDGSEDIAGVVKEAKERGLVALALTDHNSGDGVPAFMGACEDAGILGLEGTEIYAAFPDTDWARDKTKCGPVPDMTILGRKLDWKVFANEYRKPLYEYQSKIWMPQTIDKLKKLGFYVPDLSQEEMKNQVYEGTVPRAFHDVPKDSRNWPRMLEICRDDFKATITVEEIQKNPIGIFNRYVYSVEGGAYVLRGPQEFGVKEAVNLAEEMKGALFAAHPGGNYANWSIQHLDYFVEMGGSGIEVWQYYHKPDQIRLFLEYAVRYNLLVSGGSDWHGKGVRNGLGCWDKPENQTPAWVIEHLLDRLP